MKLRLLLHALMRAASLSALLTVPISTLTAQGPTDVRLYEGRLPSSQSIDYLVQFSGGGDPDAMYLGSTLAQIDVLERKPDGSPRVFRAFAPLRGSVTGGVISFNDGPLPTTANPSTLFPSSANPGALNFKLKNAAGTYEASIASATNVETLVGPGNPKGHSGADYLRVKRYFCPFVNPAATQPSEQTCGAMIVYVTTRFDLQGYIVECLFANSSLAAPVASYDGDVPENPGHIVYESLELETGSASMNVVHADTYGGPGGVNGNFLASA
ncbi:MAG: hypothetical protein AAF196_21155, partial [Planctomycetota bacterium]